MKEGKGTILDFLLKQEDIDVNQVTEKEPCPPIFLACQNIDKDSFAKLVSARANIYGTKANGKNILHYLINSKYDAEKTLDFTKLKIMHQIIERICNVNHADRVMVLINEPDQLKKTPLHYATLLPGQRQDSAMSTIIIDGNLFFPSGTTERLWPHTMDRFSDFV